jgi:hypothetical protein
MGPSSPNSLLVSRHFVPNGKPSCAIMAHLAPSEKPEFKIYCVLSDFVCSAAIKTPRIQINAVECAAP